MKNNKLALWAGISSFFATLLALGAINILNPDERVRFVGGVVVGLITAGTVYSKQRLDDEKKARVLGGKIIVTDVGDKKIFSLELDEDPEVLEQGNEVIFKVEKGTGG
ncbi:MAG: hypothetical protein ACJ8BW_02015 [Ktedonobacteraceae bacterium]|jgi:hypothetical protein